MRAQEFIVENNHKVTRDGILLDYNFGQNNQTLKITALSGDGNKELGFARFRDYGPKGNPKYQSDEVHVDERYRRQGIATIIYNFARELLGQVYPSSGQTDDGESFWQGKEVWENEEVEEARLPEITRGSITIRLNMDHIVDQAVDRKVKSDAIERVLDTLTNIKPKFKQFAPGEEFWVHSNSENISLGFKMINPDNRVLRFNTVIQGRTRGDRNPTLETY